MSEAYAPSPRADKVADWLEREVIRQDRSLGAAPLHALGGAADIREADIDLGWHTMSRRAALLGEAYPFRTGSGIAARPHVDAYPWTAMLLMSADSPARAGMDLKQAALVHEQITSAALRSLYGEGTQSLRFGWPSDVGRPREFPEAVRWLAGQMGVPVGTAYRPPYAKDGGVDVVAWLPFPDKRSGFPVMLVQCTLERDYVHKAHDVDVRIWAGWLRLDVDPATALAVPEVVAAGEAWNMLAARTVVLDRIRLAALLGAQQQPDASLAAVQGWTTAAIERLRG